MMVVEAPDLGTKGRPADNCQPRRWSALSLRRIGAETLKRAGNPRTRAQIAYFYADCALDLSWRRDRIALVILTTSIT